MSTAIIIMTMMSIVAAITIITTMREARLRNMA